MHHHPPQKKREQATSAAEAEEAGRTLKSGGAKGKEGSSEVVFQTDKQTNKQKGHL